MKAQFWLKISVGKTKGGYTWSDWQFLGAKTYTKKPDTGRNEIAVKMDIDIPDSFFEKPQLQASISIPENAPHGGEITTEIADNISELIARQLGVTVHISMDECEETE